MSGSAFFAVRHLTQLHPLLQTRHRSTLYPLSRHLGRPPSNVSKFPGNAWHNAPTPLLTIQMTYPVSDRTISLDCCGVETNVKPMLDVSAAINEDNMEKSDASAIMIDINNINSAIELALQRIVSYSNEPDIVKIKQALCALTFDVDKNLVRPIVAQFADLDPHAAWNAAQDKDSS